MNVFEELERLRQVEERLLRLQNGAPDHLWPTLRIAQYYWEVRMARERLEKQMGV